MLVGSVVAFRRPVIEVWTVGIGVFCSKVLNYMNNIPEKYKESEGFKFRNKKLNETKNTDDVIHEGDETLV